MEKLFNKRFAKVSLFVQQLQDSCRLFEGVSKGLPYVTSLTMTLPLKWPFGTVPSGHRITTRSITQTGDSGKGSHIPAGTGILFPQSIRFSAHQAPRP